MINRRHLDLYIFLILLLLTGSINAYDWNESQHQSDTAKIRILINECWENRGNRPQIALEKGNEALKLARQINNKSLEAKALNLIGVVYRAKADYDKSLEYSNEALNVAERCKDSTEIGFALNNIGGTFRNRGYYSLALQHVFKALYIFGRMNDKSGMAFCTINIGFIYRLQSNYPKALSYFEQTFDLRKEIGDRPEQAIALRWIANSYADLGRYDTALETYSRVEKDYAEFNSNAEKIATYKGMGFVFLKQKRYNEALKYFENALGLSFKTGSVGAEISCRNSIGIILSNQGKFSEAEKNLEKAMELNNKINDLELKLDCYNATSIFYELKGDLKKSLLYLRMFSALKDSVITNYTISSANEMEAVYKNEQSKRDNALLMKNIEISENRITYLIIILLMLIIISIFIYGRFHFKKIANKKLNELNATKDKFFGIIAHDLKNPFHTIFSTTRVLIDNFDQLTNEDKLELIKNIESAGEKTYRLLENLLYWSLSQTGGLNFSPRIIDLSKIINETLNLFEAQAKNKNIRLTFSAESESVYADEEMIKTVVRNLVSNAIKYTDLGGNVSIHVDKKSEEVEVSVVDTGVGIDEETLNKIFQIDNVKSAPGTNGEKGTGLGLILCKEFIKKNKGKIWVESQPGKGSKFSFSLQSKFTSN